jgi:hypothetical protein
MGKKLKTTKLDIHVHTPSSDGHGSPQEYVTAIQKAGLDGIVITDHHVTRGIGPGDKKVSRIVPASNAIVKAIRDAGLLCFRGCEYSTANGHLLIYGVDVAELNLGMYEPMQKVIWLVREHGGVAIPSHPFYGFRKQLGSDVFKLKDLVSLETINGKLSVQYPLKNDEADKAASKLSLGGIGNSDAHYANRIGTCYTEFAGSIRRPSDLVKALLARDHQAVENRRRTSKQRQDYMRDLAEWKSWNGYGGGYKPVSGGLSTPSFAGSTSSGYASGRGGYHFQDSAQGSLWEDDQFWSPESIEEELEALGLEGDDDGDPELEAQGFEHLGGGTYRLRHDRDDPYADGYPDELIPQEAFTDPFFVGDERTAVSALDAWARHQEEQSRSRKRQLRGSRKRKLS